MGQHNYSQEIFEIMGREMGLLGEHIVKKQCYENGILYSHITWEDIPKLSKAISKVMLGFGEEKSKKIMKEIRNLVDMNALLEKEENPLTRAKLFSQMGDSAVLTGDLDKALDYYENAKCCAEGLDSATNEINKRIRMIS